ncbi:glycosyltransferase [Lachnospiraceae bacterium ZAX-1]
MKRKTREKQKEVLNDILLQTGNDRRMLPNVPDIEKIRNNTDRRGQIMLEDFEGSYTEYMRAQKAGIRYETAYSVRLNIVLKRSKRKVSFQCKSTNISDTGILLNITDKKHLAWLDDAESLVLHFKIKPGSMPEGYEGKIHIGARIVRKFQLSQEKGIFCGAEFDEPLFEYIRKRKGRYTLMISSFLLFLIVLVIMLMRVESVIYFKFNRYLYLYSIIAATFLLSRYLFGTFYRVVPVDRDFTPAVTIIIPCFNEEEWIQKTILSCVNQDYPIDALEVLVVDDCSTDKSVEKSNEIIARLTKENPRFKIKERVTCVVQEQNKGKRDALARGALIAKHDLIVFVDSDSFLDPYAIRNLVQPFKDPKMGGVSGRTDVANTYTNAVTKMQSVRYYIAFRIMKAAEAYFDAVTCLSGPLACYKREIILENMDAWLNQKFLGQRATFGDDRSMTNFILRTSRTGYQDTAICHTIVPNQHSVFLKQQMRWKRSWLRESIIAASFMFKKEPFMSFCFYMGVIVPIAAPVVVIYNLFYVPITHHIFPTTFLVGIFMMSMLMSAAQLLLRRSSIWLYGMWFCIYYEAVLLWQMPIAWVTFWKSTWGTRMTPEDVKEQEKKEQRKQEIENEKLEAKRKKQRNRKGRQEDDRTEVVLSNDSLSWKHKKEAEEQQMIGEPGKARLEKKEITEQQMVEKPGKAKIEEKEITEQQMVEKPGKVKLEEWSKEELDALDDESIKEWVNEKLNKEPDKGLNKEPDKGLNKEPDKGLNKEPDKESDKENKEKSGKENVEEWASDVSNQEDIEGWASDVPSKESLKEWIRAA